MELPQTLAGIGAPGVDPTPSELEAIGSVATAFDWIGAGIGLREAVATALGSGNLRLRDIVLISDEEWAVWVSGALAATGDGIVAKTPQDRPAEKSGKDTRPVRSPSRAVNHRTCVIKCHQV